MNSFGDVFVTRVAGNIVTNEITGSLEFGTAVLGAQVLMVLGHSSCGAVAATIAGNPVPGVISSLYYGYVYLGDGIEEEEEEEEEEDNEMMMKKEDTPSLTHSPPSLHQQHQACCVQVR